MTVPYLKQECLARRERQSLHDCIAKEMSNEFLRVILNEGGLNNEIGMI